MTEMKVLVARGHSAIRSLKLILLNIAAVENRIKVNIDNLDKGNNEYKLIKSTYEEVIEKCNILEEEIVSSIENWTDIIPEIGNIKTQIGVLSEMKLKVLELDGEIKKSKKDIESVKEIEGKRKEELVKELKTRENELSKARAKLLEKEDELNRSVLGGIFPSGSIYGLGATGAVGGALGAGGYGVGGLGATGFSGVYELSGYPKKCISCKKNFTTFDSDQNLCSDCRKHGGEEPAVVAFEE